MAKRITVVVSQGQSANPVKRRLEEELVAALIGERNLELTVVPHLYDLNPEHTGLLCLQGISGDMIVLSWLFSRAAHWTLDRNDIRGNIGTTLLDYESDEDDEESPSKDQAVDGDKPRVHDSRPLPQRKIYCIDLRVKNEVQPYVDEIRRIVRETQVQTVSILGLLNSSPNTVVAPRVELPVIASPASELMAESDAPAAVTRITEESPRRWYPVIDYSRCTNCMECIDFCLFGVYGVDRADAILVEQPDNCRKGCPACSRVCPENAIIFPQHKTPSIAGSPNEEAGGGLKIDLSKLFGAPDALNQAVLERDVELVAVGRDAVGAAVGVPDRSPKKPKGPRDELDDLIDSLDQMEL